MSETVARRKRMPEETRHTLLGAAVVALFVGLFAYSNVTDGGPSGSYSVIAKFNTVEGIYVDSAVRLSGVDIGRVSALGYDSATQRAVVTMELRPDIEMPLDSLALITSEGMMGGRFIRLDPGGEIDALTEGDEIEFTQDSILFEELLAKIILTVEANRLKKRAAEEAEASKKNEEVQ